MTVDTPTPDTLPATVAALRTEIEPLARAVIMRPSYIPRDDMDFVPQWLANVDALAGHMPRILSVLARVEALCAVAEAAEMLMELTGGKAWPTRELWEAAGVLRTALAAASGRAS